MEVTVGSYSVAQQVHSRVYPLQCTLDRLNNGQGLGFVVLTKVVDKKTLYWILMSLVSLFSTSIPLLVALLPDLHTADGPSCELSGPQQALLKSTFAQFNASCNWSANNKTIASLWL
jgi:hypothetical protein